MLTEKECTNCLLYDTVVFPFFIKSFYIYKVSQARLHLKKDYLTIAFHFSKPLRDIQKCLFKIIVLIKNKFLILKIDLYNLHETVFPISIF